MLQITLELELQLGVDLGRHSALPGPSLQPAHPLNLSWRGLGLSPLVGQDFEPILKLVGTKRTACYLVS